MKKLLITLPLLALGLAGCNASANYTPSNSSKTTSKSSNETVQLTLDNFSTYVATNSSSTVNTTSGYETYYTYFIGTDFCKFIDCTVSYGYAYYNNSFDGLSETVRLSLSGDGEAKPLHVQTRSTTMYYQFVLLSVSGTVEIL